MNHTLPKSTLLLLLSLALTGCSGSGPASDQSGTGIPKTTAGSTAQQLSAAVLGEPDPHEIWNDPRLQEFRQQHLQDTNNGMPSYLMASVYAHHGDWTTAGQLLKQGNEAAYWKQLSSDQKKRLVETLMSLDSLPGIARRAAANQGAIGSGNIAEILQELRLAGGHIAGAEPKEATTMLAGTALRRAADEALVRLYRQTGEKAKLQAAQQQLDDDSDWARSIRENVDSKLKVVGLNSDGTIARAAHSAGQALQKAGVKLPTGAQIGAAAKSGAGDFFKALTPQ